MRTPPMPWFRKHHTCPCGTQWWDEWDCLCNDRCPTCNAEIEPDGWEEVKKPRAGTIKIGWQVGQLIRVRLLRQDRSPVIRLKRRLNRRHVVHKIKDESVVLLWM